MSTRRDSIDLAPLRGRTLLIVDDHPLVRQSLRAWLRRACPGLAIRTTSSGRGAVRMVARRRGIEMVLMDVHMPGMNGLEATRAIRGKAPHVEVVLMSADPTEDDEAVGITAGARTLILKADLQDRLLPALLELVPGAGKITQSSGIRRRAYNSRHNRRGGATNEQAGK